MRSKSHAWDVRRDRLPSINPFTKRPQLPNSIVVGPSPDKTCGVYNEATDLFLTTTHRGAVADYWVRLLGRWAWCVCIVGGVRAPSYRRIGGRTCDSIGCLKEGGAVVVPDKQTP